jgi:small conductance mechanosensitive channel
MPTLPPHYHYIAVAIVAFIAAAILSNLFNRVINYAIRKRWEEGIEDVTRLKFLANSASAIFYTLAIAFTFIEIPALSSVGQALFAGAGVLAAIIGFASQKAFSNIISGIFILLFRPFKVGDFITVAQSNGVIEDITLRHTVIRDFENRRVIIPNSIISDDTIVNSSILDARIRQMVFFSIAYDADMDRAINIIREECMTHPFYLDQRSDEEKAEGDEPVVIRVVAWEDSSIKLRAQVWTANLEDGFYLKCDLLYSVKKAFDLAAIEIPYPHRTIVEKKTAIRPSVGND